MINSRLINTKVAGGGGCTDIVNNYDPFGGNGVALYQLNGDTTDVSGNYDAIDVRGLSYVDGVFGQAASFASNGNFNTGYSLSGSYTISLWCKNTASGYDVFNTTNSSGDNGIIFRGLRGGAVGFIDKWGGGGNYAVHSYTYPQDTNWHQFVLSFTNNNNCKIYFDGAFILDFNSAQSTFINSTSLNFGEGLNTGNNPTGINLDQVRIFNTALLPLEVEALYTEELCICDGTVDTLDILGDGSCIATYTLDGNANDLSGNYSGTPTNVSYGVGEFDLAGVFNGGTSSFQAANGISSQGTDLTFSLWYKTNNISTTQILVDFNFSAGNGIQLYNTTIGSAGTLVYRAQINGVDNIFQIIQTGAITSNNTWNNVVITYENKTSGLAKIYVNGNFLSTATSTQTGVATFGSGNQYLGSRNTGASALNGSLDQVRIFNKALNSTEVTTLYNETACSINCTGSDLTDYYFNGVQTSSLTCLFDFYMSPDGTKMYTIKGYGNTVSQYTLNTPYSVSSSTFVRDRTSTNTTPIVGLQFKPDGTKMYVYSNSGVAALQEFTLSTAWDISTASLTTTINTSGQVSAGNGLGLFIKPDGTKFYVTSVSTKRIYQYSMGSAWTLSGASYDSIQSPVFTELIRSPHITNDGSKLFCGINGAYQYDLITDWDITTLVYKETLTSSPYSDCITLHLNDDEDKMYILNAENSIYELELTCTPN